MPKSKPLPEGYKKTEEYVQCQQEMKTSKFITTPLKYPIGTTLDDLTVKGYIFKTNNSRYKKYRDRRELYLICKCEVCKRLRMIAPCDFGRRRETRHDICDSIFSEPNKKKPKYRYFLHTISPMGKPQMWKGVTSFCNATGFPRYSIYKALSEVEDIRKYVSFKEWLLRKVYV